MQLRAGTTVLLLLLAVVSAARGARLSRGDFVTHPGAGFGGADVSAIHPGGGTYGFGVQSFAGNSLAEALEIVSPAGFFVYNISVLGYQSFSPPAASTLVGIYLQIWDRKPDLAGASVFWGDRTTNRMALTGNTGVFRTSADLSSTARAIRWISATVGVQLPGPHTYWVEWMLEGSASYSGPWAPLANLPPTGISMQQISGSGTWSVVSDLSSSEQVDFPMRVNGRAADGGFDSCNPDEPCDNTCECKQTILHADKSLRAPPPPPAQKVRDSHELANHAAEVEA